MSAKAHVHRDVLHFLFRAELHETQKKRTEVEKERAATEAVQFARSVRAPAEASIDILDLSDGSVRLLRTVPRSPALPVSAECGPCTQLRALEHYTGTFHCQRSSWYPLAVSVSSISRRFCTYTVTACVSRKKRTICYFLSHGWNRLPLNRHLELTRQFFYRPLQVAASVRLPVPLIVFK